MRVLQLRGHQHLAPEPLDRNPGEQFGRQDLDDDLSVERLLSGEIGAGHAAATQFPIDDIAGAQRPLKTGTQVVHSASGRCGHEGVRELPQSKDSNP